MRIPHIHATFLSDTRHCQMVTPRSVCRTTVPDSGSGFSTGGYICFLSCVALCRVPARNVRTTLHSELQRQLWRQLWQSLGQLHVQTGIQDFYLCWRYTLVVNVIVFVLTKLWCMKNSATLCSARHALCSADIHFMRSACMHDRNHLFEKKYFIYHRYPNAHHYFIR